MAELSPILKGLPAEKRVTWYFSEDGHQQGYVTLEMYDAMLDEYKRRWKRDQEFARKVCSENGIDIDAIAKNAPEYQT